MPATEFNIEDFESVLVVEGYSDLLFYAEILESVDRHGQVFIKELGGKAGLSVKLETLINPNLLNTKKSIGFVFDADNNPQASREMLERLLTRLTSQTVVDGAWTNGTPRIGLMTVPGGTQTGEIETLVWNSWSNDPANAKQRQCVMDYVACMQNGGKAAHSPDKGLIGALLAIRSDEDPRLGPGARDNVFDLTRPELNLLREFLRAC